MMQCLVSLSQRQLIDHKKIHASEKVQQKHINQDESKTFKEFSYSCFYVPIVLEPFSGAYSFRLD